MHLLFLSKILENVFYSDQKILVKKKIQNLVHKKEIRVDKIQRSQLLLQQAGFFY